jgi:hypothetical protein
MGRPMMKLCWIGEVPSERDWFHFLLSDVLTGEAFCDDFPPPAPHTLYGFDSNHIPLRSIPPAFLESARVTRGIGLLHLADEWYGHDYNIYANFAFVIRTHAATALRHPGLLTVPLGLPRGCAPRGAVIRASERQFVWSFAGNLVATRADVVRALAEIRPSAVHIYTMKAADAPPLTKPRFQALLGDTTFTPAPMGNVMAETWRLYEALEAGSIPIVEKRLGFDYFENLFGKHPLPAFHTWEAAAAFITRIRHDHGAVDDLQARVMAWWAAYKADLKARVSAFVTAAGDDAYRSDMARFRFPTGAARVSWQYLELAKHHSIAALARRISIMARRRSLSRGA